MITQLQTNYVDLYLIHSPTFCDEGIQNSWNTLEKLKDQGKIINIGVSNFRISDLKQIQEYKYKPTINQIEFHPFVFDKAEALLKYCQQEDIRLASYGGLVPITKHPENELNELLDTLANKYNTNSQYMFFII